MKRLTSTFYFCLSISIALLAQTVLAANTSSLRIVASIQPLADIVASVIGNTETLDTIVPVNSSPHTYQLRPSQAQAIQQADVIFWFGPALEGFLPKIIEKNKIHAVQLLNNKRIHLLPLRNAEQWELDADDTGKFDPHVWLSTDNAAAIAHIVADKMASLEPTKGKYYEHNAETFILNLQKTQTLVAEQLANVDHVPYLVFHDGYQYFEHEFKLHPVGSITIQPDQPLSAKRISDIAEKITKENVHCLFKEPQFSPQATQFFENTFQIHVETLDPLGQNATPDPTNYFDLITKIGATITDCLSREKKLK